MSHFRKNKKGELFQCFSQPNQSSRVNYRPRQSPQQNSREPSTSKTTTKQPIQCKFCTRTHLFGRESFPAWGQTCAICKQKDHFAATQLCWMKKHIQAVGEQPQYEENDLNLLLVNSLFLGSINYTNIKRTKDWEIKLKTEKENITLKIGIQHLTQMGLTPKDIKDTN